MNAEEFTTEQQEVYTSFKEITQFVEEDNEKIVNLLKNCQWNLEIAIPRFFDNNFEFPVNQPASVPVIPSSRPQDFQNQDSFLNFDQVSHFDLRRGFPKADKLPSNWPLKHGIKINGSENFTILPSNPNTNSNYLIFVLLLLPRTLTFILLKFTDLLTFLYNNIFGKDNGKFPNGGPKFIYDSNNKEKSEKETNRQFFFKKYFEENVLKDTSDESLPILNDEYVSFNQAYDMAKSELKFLILILVDTENNKDSCDYFLKRFLGSQNIQKIVNDQINGKDFFIWGTDVNYLEGYLIGCKYNCKRTPYIALIGNVSTFGETFPTMSLMKYKNLNLESDGSQLDVDSTLKSFTKCIGRYSSQLVSQRIDKEQKDLERLMKQEQDNAYLQSLEQDKIKKREKETKLKKIKEKKTITLYKKLAEYRFVKYLIQEMVSKFADVLLSDDKIAIYDGVVDNSGDSILLQFKILQSGDKFIKRMSKKNTLNDIHLYVLLRLVIEKMVEIGKFDSKEDVLNHFKLSNAAQNLETINPNIEFKFELSSPFPKFKLEQSNEITIFDTKQLTPSCSLLVEYDLDFDSQFRFILETIDNPQLEEICSGSVLTVDSINDDEIIED